MRYGPNIAKADLGRGAAAATLVVVAAALAYARLRGIRGENTAIFVQGAYRANTGVVGVALAAAAYGEEGVALAAMPVAPRRYSPTMNPERALARRADLVVVGIGELSAEEAARLVRVEYEDAGDEPVLVRVHSECLTGDVFGSERCECGPQLKSALELIDADHEGGMLIYMSGHEGRGIGLWAKAVTYLLQDMGQDTYDANTALGLPEDSRDFTDAAVALRHPDGRPMLRHIVALEDCVQAFLLLCTR